MRQDLRKTGLADLSAYAERRGLPICVVQVVSRLEQRMRS